MKYPPDNALSFSVPTGRNTFYRFIYTNYKGERELRMAIPSKVFFGATEWHPDRQWLIEMFDLYKREVRVFAMRDMEQVTQEELL